MKKYGINSWSTVTAILDKIGVKRRSISEGVRSWCKKRKQRALLRLKENGDSHAKTVEKRSNRNLTRVVRHRGNYNVSDRLDKSFSVSIFINNPAVVTVKKASSRPNIVGSSSLMIFPSSSKI